MVTAVGHQDSGAQIPNKKKLKKYMKIKKEEKEKGSIPLYSLSNSQWQLAFTDVIADLIPIIPFSSQQKIAEVFFFSLFFFF